MFHFDTFCQHTVQKVHISFLFRQSVLFYQLVVVNSSRKRLYVCFWFYYCASCQVQCLFFSGHTCGTWKFSGQGSNWSCRWGLHHSHGNSRLQAHLRPTYAVVCGNAGSLIHWVRAEIKPASSQTPRWVLNPLSHNGNCQS